MKQADYSYKSCRLGYHFEGDDFEYLSETIHASGYPNFQFLVLKTLFTRQGEQLVEIVPDYLLAYLLSSSLVIENIYLDL